MAPQTGTAPQGYRVVCIGGGTGLSAVLRGLKHHVRLPGQTSDISTEPAISILTAIVTVTDDGGSSGRLRKELNVLPPGDIRNCMIALSEDEALLSRLFQYRFSAGIGLEGHSFGNLFLTALASLTGDFSEAVQLSSLILKTRGEIFPSTTANVQLLAYMADGTRVRGETNITASNSRILKLQLVPANAQPLSSTLDAIAAADLITIGPGSLFTSLVPNLLVRGIPEAISRSTAVKAYVCNLMTQANESLDLAASQHIRALFEHAGRKVFDYALINDASVPKPLLERYAQERASQIVNDLDEVRALGVEPVLGNYLDCGTVARHAADRIALDLLSLVTRARQTGKATIVADAEFPFR